MTSIKDVAEVLWLALKLIGPAAVLLFSIGRLFQLWKERERQLHEVTMQLAQMATRVHRLERALSRKADSIPASSKEDSAGEKYEDLIERIMRTNNNLAEKLVIFVEVLCSDCSRSGKQSPRRWSWDEKPNPSAADLEFINPRRTHC